MNKSFLKTLVVIQNQFKGLSMRSRVKLLFFFSVLIVGLYVVLVLNQLSRFHGGPLYKTSQKDDWQVDTVEDDETIQLEKIQFGGLNQHSWEKHCQISFEKLCNFPIFPKAPDERNFVENVNITSSVNEADGLRLLGFLRPNATGSYRFLVSSSGFAEVWLSANKNWKNAKKIASAKPSIPAPNNQTVGELKSEISNNISLSARQTYYIEVIFARGIQKKSGPLIQLAWRRPDKSAFEIIDRSFFSPYTNDSSKAKMKVYDDDLPDVLACTSLRLNAANKYMKPETIPFLNSTAVNRALEFCEYRPSYLLDPANVKGFRLYQGVYSHVHKTYSFPYPNVDGIARNQGAPQAFLAENPLEKQEAWSVVNRYLASLEKSYPG